MYSNTILFYQTTLNFNYCRIDIDKILKQHVNVKNIRRLSNIGIIDLNELGKPKKFDGLNLNNLLKA